MPLLRLHSLSKNYGPATVVNQLDMEVEAGQIFGLLGPNGAGKTTTISMIAGVLAPSSGRVVIDGHDVVREANLAKAVVGLVPQELALYESLSARQNLFFFGSLYQLQGRELRTRVDWALDIAGLRDRAEEPVSRFSGGMKRRLNLGAGILHKPKLLILDEPTVGIDPQSRIHIFNCLRALSDDHDMTTLYTSHYLEEVQELCRRVAIMDQGNIIANDEVATLLSQQKSDEVIFELEGDLEGAQSAARQHGEATIVDDRLHVVTVAPFGPLIAAIEDEQVVIRSIHTAEATLENLFLRLTGRELRDR